MKKIIYLAYAWASTFLFSLLILWTATVPEYEAGTGFWDQVLKIIFRMVLYSVFFLLIYRSIVGTLKNTVDRLAQWRSKGEELEDAEFVLIVETLVVIISILVIIIFASFEEYLQTFVRGRNAELKDVLISTMAALLTGIVVYSMPVIGEAEVMLKQKTKKLIKKLRK